MNNQILLIIGMMLATYIPRLLPFIMVSGKKLPKRLEMLLKYIPYTALGALIIPGVFSAIPRMPLVSLSAIVFSFVYAWYKGGIIIPVLGSILVAFGMILMKNGYIF